MKSRRSLPERAAARRAWLERTLATGTLDDAYAFRPVPAPRRRRDRDRAPTSPDAALARTAAQPAAS